MFWCILLLLRLVCFWWLIVVVVVSCWVVAGCGLADWLRFVRL